MHAYCLALLGCFGVFVSGSAWAIAPDVPDSLRYLPASCPEGRPLEGRRAQDVVEILQVFQARGWQGVNSGFGKGGEGVFGADDVLTTEDAEEFAVLKLCLEPANESELGLLYRVGEAFLFHGKSPAGLPYALYFEGVSEATARDLVGQLEGRLGPTKTSLLRRAVDWVEPRAHAEPKGGWHRPARPADSPPELERESPPDPQAKARQREESTTRGILRSTLVGCGKGLAKGLYQSTVGAAIAVGKAGIQFVKSSIWAAGHPKEAWQRVSTRFRQAREIVKNFSVSKALKGGKGGFNAMPYEEKVKFICMLTAEIGVGATLAIFAAPTLPLVAQGLLNALGTSNGLNSFKEWFFQQPAGGIKPGARPRTSGP